MWHMLHEATGTLCVFCSFVTRVFTSWHVEQLSSAWLANSCRKVPEEVRVLHASRITRVVRPIFVARPASKSAGPIGSLYL